VDKRERTDAVILKVEGRLADAKPVPLTDQVRLDLREMQALIVELRQALAAERGW
jgi:hypothetical protein